MAFFKSLVSSIKKGLTKTREVLVDGLRSLLRGKRLDDALITQLEARLIGADVGVKTTRRLIDTIRADFKAGRIETGDQVLEFLKADLKSMWPDHDRRLRVPQPGAGARGETTVFLIAGVNGAGKTTSIAKLAHMLKEQGLSVVVAAGDTFRAGAVRQLEIWADRLGIPIIKGKQGGDPAAVAFDACDAALARKADVLIIDTAGRLHTQDALMRQLGKIRDIVSKKIPGGPHEVLLVLDATTGQNAIRQAEEFNRVIAVTGIILAKLDGTARGGVVIAIRDTVQIPVKLVGTGETVDDLEVFDPEPFVDAMFEE
jgi:fused signal recognition particle receptor